MPWERRTLQVLVALASCVPVGAGLAGALLGPSLVPDEPFGPSTDSHYRYLSGLLLGIGLSFWAAVPQIERRTIVLPALASIVVLGGLARLAGLFLAEAPPNLPMRLALVMELLVTPALAGWQWRLSRRTAQGATV
jgi:hypothetical protein